MSIGRWLKGEEGLQVLEGRMTTMDPDLNEIYNFLRVEQGNGITPKNIFERMKDEVAKRAKLLVNTKLKDTNLIAAINAVVISAAAY